MKKYGMTKKKIIHLIAESDQNGINGYWYAVWICGAYTKEQIGMDQNCLSIRR